MLIYSQFAHYVLMMEKKNGKHLSFGTVCDYVRGLMFEAKKLHGAAHPHFFACMDKNDNGWLKQMLLNIQRVIMKRCLDAGEPLSSQASAIYRDAMIEICRVLKQIDSDESISRSLV